VWKTISNAVEKHHIIGSKEHILITSLSGLCDAESKREVKYVLKCLFGIWRKRGSYNDQLTGLLR